MRPTLLAFFIVLLPLSAHADEPSNLLEPWQGSILSILDDFRALFEAAHGWIDPVGQAAPQPDGGAPTNHSTHAVPSYGWIDPVGSDHHGDDSGASNNDGSPAPGPPPGGPVN